MTNRRGKTVTDRLNEDIKYAESMTNAAQRETLALKALGAVDFAVEFGLITYTEWTKYINRIFAMV